MTIESYSDMYFESLIAFLKNNWAPNHSIYEKKLFDWQYGGSARDHSASVLLLGDFGEIQGFLGAIPYPFLLKNEIKHAAGLAIWVVDKEIKNSGAGLYLRNAVEDSFEITYTIGLNLSTIRYYQKRNYCYYDSVNRYVAPLDAEGYQLFIVEPCEQKGIKDWLKTICFTTPAVPSASLDPGAFSEIYQRGVAPYFSLLPQKDTAFWEWRYLNSEGFSYQYYHNKDNIMVFRVEDTYSSDDLVRHGKKILRVIEILPCNGNVWNGDADKDLTDTILSVLTWGKQQGCVLADFQISNSRLKHILEKAGFRLQLNIGETNIVRLFSPFRITASPLNFVYRVFDGNEFISVDREDTYLLKSDTDMDRPNWLGNE